MSSSLQKFYNNSNSILAILSFVLIFISANVFSQNLKLQGWVYDRSTLLPLTACVKIFASDSLIDSTRCGTSGDFIFENLFAGIYRMEVSFQGYRKVVKDSIKLSYSDISPVSDTLYLEQDSYVTDEIVVEEEKGFMQFSGEKKIFNVSETMYSKGGTVIDILRAIPMIEVDNNDNVFIRGNRNIKIHLNNKPLNHGGLRQIPSDVVSSIEVITNPSAKYEAEGFGGIINIVLRKRSSLGFNGVASLTGGFRNRVNAGLNLNFKKKKFSFFSSLYSGIFNYVFDNYSKINYYSPVSNYETKGATEGNNRYLWAQTGAEYEIYNAAVVGTELGFSKGGFETFYKSKGKLYDSTDLLISSQDLTNDRIGVWNTLNSSVYFSVRPEARSYEFQSEISYTANTYNWFLTQNKNILSDLLSTRRDTTETNSDNVIIQLDYLNSFNNFKLEAGYKGNFNLLENNFHSDTLNRQTGIFTDDGSSNKFKLRETVNAGYLVFSGPISILSFKIGLRVEHTLTKGETIDYDFYRSYYNFFPTLSLSAKISNSQQFQLSYSKRITRPAAWRLNPFLNKSEVRNYFKGNPELRPEITDSYELSYSVYLPFINITPLLFYRNTRDVISSYNYLLDSNVSVTTYLNGSGMKSYGLDLFLSSKSLTWLNLNSTFSFYNTRFEYNPLGSDYQAEEGSSWKVSLKGILTILSLFNLEAAYSYTGSKVNSQGVIMPTSSFDAGISKSILNNKLNISLKATDIFRTSLWEQNISGNGFSQLSKNITDSRTVTLSVSYSFGNTEEFISRKRKIKQNPNESKDIQENQDK